MWLTVENRQFYLLVSLSVFIRFRKATANFVVSAYPFFCPSGIDRAHWTGMREQLHCGFQPQFVGQQ
jgi:hypothetical protein